MSDHADTLRDHLIGLVRAHDADRPRSRQRAIGPSEIGHPCMRRLGYRLLDADTVNTDTDPWAAYVGTAVHAALAEAAMHANGPATRPANTTRHYVEHRMPVTDDIGGHADLYIAGLDESAVIDRTIVDHKVVGATTMKAAKKDGPSDQYRTQVHLYGYGAVRKGLPVDHVAIAYWSRSGWLKDLYVWSEPYDQTIAEKALERLHAIDALTATLGTQALSLLPASGPNCQWCPWYIPAVIDPAEGCRGA